MRISNEPYQGGQSLPEKTKDFFEADNKLEIKRLKELTKGMGVGETCSLKNSWLVSSRRAPNAN